MRRIGPYEVEAELGRGGMGVVLRARDPALRRTVAIKLVTGIDARRKARFAREAEALAKLEHPNIVRLLHAGEEEAGQPYLVLELIDGEDLETRLGREGPLPIDEAVELTRTLAAALQHAHERGVLHRDLKPGNVLIDRSGRPLLTDFGLALDLDPERSRLSHSGNSMGTPGFWPPEQARGLREAGPTNDVYGLGATLYALLTGGPPYVCESFHELVLAMAKPPASPSVLRPDVPKDLEAVVLRCLAERPEDRFQTIAAVAAALPKKRRASSAAAKPAPGGAGNSRALRPREIVGLTLLAVVALVAVVQSNAATTVEGAHAAAERRANELWSQLENARAEATRSEAIATAGSRADEERARKAEERARKAEERAHEAEERAHEAEQRASDAEERARLAEDQRELVVRLAAVGEDPEARAAREREMSAANALPRASDPAGAAPAFERALLRHRANDNEGAVQLYTEALRLDPRHARAYRNRGNARAVYSDHAAAQRDYGLAIGLGELARARGEVGALPELVAALYSRAEQANGTIGFTDYPGALRDYTRALALHPDYWMALRGRGDVLLELGEPAKALVDLERARTLTPADQLTARASIDRNLPRARAAIAAGQ